jgi:hypothetical protein
MDVTISRGKIYPTPGRNYRAAWKWRYTVRAGEQNYSGDGIGWARRLAAQKADGGKVTELWKE